MTRIGRIGAKTFSLLIGTVLAPAGCDFLDEVEDQVGLEETIEVVYVRELEVRSREHLTDVAIGPARITPCDDAYVCDNFNRVKSIEVTHAERTVIYIGAPAQTLSHPTTGGWDVFLSGLSLDRDFYEDVSDVLNVAQPLDNAATRALGPLLMERQNAEIRGTGFSDPVLHRFGLRFRIVAHVTFDVL